jgi:acylpyruvate hydrolase
MRFAHFEGPLGPGLAVDTPDGWRGHTCDDPRHPGDLLSLLTAGEDALIQAHALLGDGEAVDLATVTLKPPVSRPGKIICVGLNFAQHAAETGFKTPEVPEIFARFSTSLVGGEEPLRRPRESVQLDFEGELAVVIGRPARRVDESGALGHVAGYCVFNDATLRDYQFRTSQWTMGKNFDGTGALGPALVTADELPDGAAGLALTTRLNGKVVQHASLEDMIFGVAPLVSFLSHVTTLEPGDVIACGTPSGVGFARTPPLWMAPGDVCEVEIERIGRLRNPVVQD